MEHIKIDRFVYSEEESVELNTNLMNMFSFPNVMIPHSAPALPLHFLACLDSSHGCSKFEDDHEFFNYAILRFLTF